MATLVTVAKWAELVFGEAAPHRNTLRSWVRERRISPAPKKVGRSYFCKPDAEYVDPSQDRVRRLVNGR
jgi:hypothetical protein